MSSHSRYTNFLCGRMCSRSQDLVEFTAPGRSPELPQVFTVDQHPLVREAHDKIYILLQDRSQEGLDLARDSASRNAETHPQSDLDIKNVGYPLLDAHQNEYVFLRDKAADNPHPADDILIAFTMSPSFYQPELLQMLKQVQEEILGDPSKITAEKPGVEFERRLRAIPNSRGDRCYPLGTSFQDGAQLTAPAKTMKAAIGESLDLSRNIIKTGASCAMQGLKMKAPELADMMDRRAVVLNTPRIGIHENTSYPGISAGCARKDQTIEDLGNAGGAHVDPHDSDVGLTCMQNLSKSQDNVDTETFVLYGLGFAVKLPEFTSLYFSGLYLHGGIQPVLLYEDQNIPLYYRLTLICYPAKALLHNNGSLAFAQLPIPPPLSEQKLNEIMSKTKEQLMSYLRNEFKAQARIMNYDSEMRETWFPQLVPPTCEGQTTFLRDGGGIMERKSYVNMITSGFFQSLSYFLSRSDADCKIQMDARTFFKSFSYCSKDDQRVHPNPEILDFLGACVEESSIEEDGENDSSTLKSYKYDEVTRCLEDSKAAWKEYQEKRQASIGRVKKLQKRGSINKSKNLKKRGRDRDHKKDQVRADDENDDENDKDATTSSENGQDSEYRLRTRKRKRDKTDIGGLERSLQPRVLHDVATKNKKTMNKTNLKKKALSIFARKNRASSSRRTALKEASSLPRVLRNRRGREVVRRTRSTPGKNRVRFSPGPATFQQPSKSTLKENSKAPRGNCLPILQIGVGDMDRMSELLQLVRVSPSSAFKDTATSLCQETHLPQSSSVLMCQLVSDLRVIENDRNLISAFEQVITGRQLLTNLLWWDTLEHEIKLSLGDSSHWLASFRHRVEDLSHKKSAVTLFRANVHESFSSIPEDLMALEYRYCVTTYRVRDTGRTDRGSSVVLPIADIKPFSSEKWWLLWDRPLSL
ncbi:hypothetical protein M378DRAFT_177490 [Amanita muscaria Koide BX008]|uniref:Uncharacterized protein n=1 Tax=Amanita muscaria (strain Koide BX008) TaxID=946122 RepID=A0A0C2XC54_AMAMK|nr:hypothetical protein M378DRAFT_177490 [Amanita muscaria Koide BX008]